MRSRVAAAAVAASLITGLAACSSTSKAVSGATPSAPGSSTSATTAVTTAATSPASAASTSANSGGSSGAFAPALLETMRSKVAAVFGQGVTVSSVFTPPTIDTRELAADFDSPATMKAVWGSGAAGSERPMDCGMAKYEGIAIGAVQASGTSAATVPVALYEGAKAGPAVVTVTLDAASGVIKGTTCGGAVNAADFPGITPVAAYYGGTVTMDKSVINQSLDPYFTPAYASWRPADADYTPPTCSQNGPDRWVVALTGTTSSASTWDFAPGPVASTVDPQVPQAPVGFRSALAVDLGSRKISRVTCGNANPPATDSAHPADYAQALMDYYRAAADQASLGVDPKAAIQPFFVSDTAFATAWKNTGTVPLLCTKKVPGSVQVANGTTPTTSGTRVTVKMVTWPNWHPDAAGQEASKFTLVLDTTSMKISSITCA